MFADFRKVIPRILMLLLFLSRTGPCNQGRINFDPGANIEAGPMGGVTLDWLIKTNLVHTDEILFKKQAQKSGSIKRKKLTYLYRSSNKRQTSQAGDRPATDVFSG